MLQAFATPTASVDAFFGLPDISSPPAAAQIRQQAAELVAQNRLLDALTLVETALPQQPDSEDLLAMMGLICEVRHDWQRARDHLEQLAKVQGNHATAQTYGHLARVIRCQGHLAQALQTAEKGLQLYPSDVLLTSEVETLRSMIQAGKKNQA